MTPKQVAVWMPIVVPLVGSLCTGVAVKVDISFNAPEERSERALKIYNAAPEMVQNVLANSEPWTDEP